MAQLAVEPRDLKIGEDNDLVVENGDLVLARGLDAIAQECRIAVQMFAEEWFLDLDAGIPYVQSILGQRRAVAELVAKKEFRAELLAVDGVLEILQLDVAFEATTRELQITWKVRTVLGDTPVDLLSLTGGT